MALDFSGISSAGGGGRDWLALIVAAYGAVVATGVAVYQFVRDRPGVRIVMDPVSLAIKGKPREEAPDYWRVRVVNHRKRPITIREGGLLGDRGQQLVREPVLGIDDQGALRPFEFPVTLTDGTSFQFYARLDLVRDRERGGAWVGDDLGRIFEAKEPKWSIRRRWAEWRARRRFEREIHGPQLP